MKATVHWCTPKLTYEPVECVDEADAIRKCPPPPEHDSNEPIVPVVIVEEE